MNLRKLLSKKFAILKKVLALIIGAVILSSCSILRKNTYTVPYYYPYKVFKYVNPGYTQVGIASWYGPKFNGRRTADGEIYNMYAHTAASKTLPFNTIVKVINLNNGKSTIVRINDRGPFIKNRIIDLSYAAARDIGMIGTGTAPVKIIVLGEAPSIASFKSTTTGEPQTNQLDKITINTNINMDIGIGTFAIQVGSFRYLFNALKLRDRLSKVLNNVYIEKKNINGTIFYRVLIGNFDTEQDAKKFALNHILSLVSKYCIIKK